MTAVRTPTARTDRSTVTEFDRRTAALRRASGRTRVTTPLDGELRSSLLLLLAVLGLPLLVVLLAAA